VQINIPRRSARSPDFGGSLQVIHSAMKGDDHSRSRVVLDLRSSSPNTLISPSLLDGGAKGLIGYCRASHCVSGHSLGSAQETAIVNDIGAVPVTT
jgi:hypothetical protein